MAYSSFFGKTPMNGAEQLVHTLAEAGTRVCFANPGTSEMHFVAALDKTSKIKCVLCLAEGIVTGAADGYSRMSGKPGITLLHLGPGLGNGLANLHNARKALSSIVNIVGDHATYHLEYDAPLTADIEGIARPVSHWVHTSRSADSIATDAQQALEVAMAHPGHIATLVLPADTAWSAVSATSDRINASAITYGEGNFSPESDPNEVDQRNGRVAEVAKALSQNKKAVLVMTGNCLFERGLNAASKIRQATGAEILAQTSNSRVERGAGRVYIDTVPYAVDQALERLSPFEQVITVCAKSPVAFFGYPEKPSKLVSPQAQHTVLALESEDGIAALEALAEELGASSLTPELQTLELPQVEDGLALDGDSIGNVVASLIPPQGIVVDEAITLGRNMGKLTRGAHPHDWLQICGGAIGDGFPLATGAAIACPERRVIALQADGSGMYSLQALWTQAREKLNITTIILSNRSYAILKHELKNVGATAGKTADDLMELDRPALDWVALAKGMGVDAVRVSNTTELKQQLAAGLEHSGPYLIEAVL